MESSIKMQMSTLISSRHLFAPAYTETCYTASGNPQTTPLKSEVSQADTCPSSALDWVLLFRVGEISDRGDLFSEGLVSSDWRPRAQTEAKSIVS